MSDTLPWTEALHARLLAGVREVGDFQLGELGRLEASDLQAKSDHSDLVTRVDRESEARLGTLLSCLLPEAGLLGEEGLRRDGAGEFRWIVDPLDGTTNFVHRHPFFAVSVALVRGRVPVLGLIHAPRLGETWEGWGDGPARLNGQPLRVSPCERPREALLATGFADRRGGRADVNLRNLDRLIHATRGVRRAGSACLDLAFTAAGRLEGFWEMGLNPWDVAAGIWLVRAAGGRVSDFAGAPDALAGAQIVASNGHLHEWLLAEIELDPRFADPPDPLA